MKIILILLIALPILCKSLPKEEDSIVPEENADETVDTENKITKRSGGGSNSFDFITKLKSGLLTGIGHASASLASGSSSSSGSGKSVDSGHHGNSLDFDPWSVKRSVLNTIFQAVKAITGGVTAIKGQLIKGSGYALSAGGKLVAASGDKVTDIGKHIVNSVHLVPDSHSSGKFNLASLSSLSASSSSGFSGHSSKGSGDQPESAAEYEIPSNHAPYGLPPKTAPYTGGTQQYLPPGTLSGNTHFGGALSYEPQSTGIHPWTNYEQPMEDQTYYISRRFNHDDNESAAKALQEIMDLIPQAEKMTKIRKHIKKDQYPIPSDATPVFKPFISDSTQRLVQIIVPEDIDSNENKQSSYDAYHKISQKQSTLYYTKNTSTTKSHKIQSPTKIYVTPEPKFQKKSYNIYNNNNHSPEHNLLRDFKLKKDYRYIPHILPITKSDMKNSVKLHIPNPALFNKQLLY